MHSPLKPGDRVRLTIRKSGKAYKVGDKGRIVWGPHTPTGRRPYYVVVMEASRIGQPEVFTENEIELDK